MPIYRTQSITPLLNAQNPLDQAEPRVELALLLREAGIPVPEGFSYSEPRGGVALDAVLAFARHVKDGLAANGRFTTLSDLVRALLLSPGTPRDVFEGAVAVYRSGLLRDLVLDTQSPTTTENWSHVLARLGTSFDDFNVGHEVATIDLVERFMVLNDAGFSINTSSEDLPSPLSVAVRTDNSATVRALLAAGASAQRDLDGWTPLHEAAFCGSAGVVSYLLTEGWSDLNTQGPASATALHLAARNGHLAALAELLRAPGVDLEAQRDDGATALWLAAKYGASKAVHRLLKAGAKANPSVVMEEPLPGGFEPLHVAAMAGHADVVEQLLTSGGIDVNAPVRVAAHTALHLAAYGGHADVVRVLLSAPSIDVNVKNRAGGDPFADDDTPLHLAAKKGHADVVRLMLGAPTVDVNARNGFGETPLFAAAENGQLEVLTTLIGVAEVDVNAISPERDETPLYVALCLGGFEAVDALVKGGARLQQVCGQANALHFVRDADTAEFLLEVGGASLLIERDEGGQTPLHRAVISEHWEVVGVFGEHPERSTAALDLSGRFAIEYALRPVLNTAAPVVASEVLRALIPEPIDSANSAGETALHMACERTDVSLLLHELLRRGANVNARTVPGRTPLHYAVLKGDPQLASILLGAGADVNAANTEGNSPLHDAVIAGRYDMVVALLDSGRAIHVPGALGKTPYQLAIQGGHMAIASALREAFPGIPRQRVS